VGDFVPRDSGHRVAYGILTLCFLALLTLLRVSLVGIGLYPIRLSWGPAREDEPRSSRRLDCGEGQTKVTTRKHKEWRGSSFCVWRRMGHESVIAAGVSSVD